MTITEVLKQAQTLSPQERKELVKLLVDLLDVGEQPPNASEEHWGQSLVHLLLELGPIDMANPEIDDPVEWVQAQRRKDAERLQPYWNEAE